MHLPDTQISICCFNNKALQKSQLLLHLKTCLQQGLVFSQTVFFLVSMIMVNTAKPTSNKSTLRDSLLKRKVFLYPNFYNFLASFIYLWPTQGLQQSSRFIQTGRLARHAGQPGTSQSTHVKTGLQEIKTDSAQGLSNKCKNYLLKIYSWHGNFLNTV